MGIYLDYSATTPPRREVRELMGQIMAQEWGNPSSIHRWGERSALVVEQARMAVGELIGSKPEEIVFTGGGNGGKSSGDFWHSEAVRATPAHHHFPGGTQRRGGTRGMARAAGLAGD
jgi:hypothetical protein